MKRLLIPVIILAGIIAIWLIQSGQEQKKTKIAAIDNFLSLEENRIDKVRIFQPGDTITVYKDNENWYLADSIPRKADANAIMNMLQQSQAIRAENIVSRNYEKQADFQVDSAAGMLVQFFNSDNLLNSLFVGKMTPGYTHTYIRKPGSDEVYLATGPLAYLYNRPLTGWLDKNIISLMTGNVESIEFIYPDKSLKLLRNDTTWSVAAAPYTNFVEANKPAVDPILSFLSNFDASDFANASDSGLIDFEHPSLILKITTFDGRIEMLTFARENPDESRRYCRRAGISETYVFMRSRLSTLMPDYAHLAQK